MTQVGFYVVPAAGEEQRLRVAARLADKAFGRGHRIFINAAGEAQARRLDDLLWSFRPASFVPHALFGAEHSERVAIGWGQDPGDHNDLLINLQPEIPAFFNRFQRVAEIVTRNEESLAVMRRSWKFYSDCGYRLEQHDL